MNWYKKTIIAGLPVYTARDFLKKLRDEFGVQFIRQGKGDDQIWGIPGTNKQTVIPVSAKSKTINPYTMTKMLKNLGLPLSAFKKQKFKTKEEIIEQPVQSKPQEIPEWKKQPWYQHQQEYTTASAIFNLSKKAKLESNLPGGRADKKKDIDFNRKELEHGQKIELEHTRDKEISTDIAKDHLKEFPSYYKELEKMENKLEDKKDAKGLYNQMQGDEYNQQAGDEIIKDWEMANREELNKMKALAKQKRFEDMKDYGEQLVQQGFNRLLVEKIMTAAMYGVRL